MKIKYVDYRPIVIPYLKYHPGGVSLPSGDNTIKVDDSEGRSLMKKRNGLKECFIEVKEPREKKTIEEVTEDGNRE